MSAGTSCDERETTTNVCEMCAEGAHAELGDLWADLHDSNGLFACSSRVLSDRHHLRTSSNRGHSDRSALERARRLRGALHKGDLGAGATKRARSKAHLGGKKRADGAPEARAEQHEKRATKTEQLVRRTTMRRPAEPLRSDCPRIPTKTRYK